MVVLGNYRVVEDVTSGVRLWRSEVSRNFPSSSRVVAWLVCRRRCSSLTTVWRRWSWNDCVAGRPLPRAAHFHVRTLELFRSAGIHEEVVRQSEREFLPEGAIISMDSLAGRKLADIIPSLNVGVDDTLSPCRRLFVTQPGLEPILRRRAERSGARVLEGCEVVDVEQDADGVTVVVRDVDSDTTHTRHARYLVAADGAHSTVRERLGIPVDGRGAFSNSITIYFTADLSAQMGGKALSVIYINNPVFGGFFRLAKDCQSGFLAVNTVGDPDSDPNVANAARDTSESRLIELVRAGAGVPDLEVRIDGVARWRATSDVAQRYHDGRVFLAGDAAHLMPPNGGFGGNTGIADAYDIAWKLALVIKGVAAPELLSTYDTERRPVGAMTVEQAYSRYVTRTATYLGATDYQPIVPDLEIELGYIYRSATIVAEDVGDGTGPRRPPPDPRPAGFTGTPSVGRARWAPVVDARSVRPMLRPAGRSARGRLVRRGTEGRGAPRRSRSRGVLRRWRRSAPTGRVVRRRLRRIRFGCSARTTRRVRRVASNLEE